MYQPNIVKKINKSDNMVVNDTKISQKMKNKNLLSIEKKYFKLRKKRSFIIIKSYCFKN